MKQHGTTFILDHPNILILDAPATPGTPENEVFAEHIVFAEAGLEARVISPCPPGVPVPADLLAAADIIMTNHVDVDEAMIRQASRCLLIVHYGPGRGSGVARIALEAARAVGIYVASVPDYAADSWAEETFLLIDRLTEQPELPNGLRAALVPAAKPSRSPRPLRLGLVGLGQVGQRVARLGRERAWDLWACDPFAGPEVFAQNEVRPADLTTIFGLCDVISLHLPLGPATRGLVSAALLALLKRPALLINDSAPELVDLDALAASLENGRPAATAFAEDLSAILPPGHPLLASARLRHGPRQAGASPADLEACRRRTAELVVLTLQGNRPPHLLIDPPCPRHVLVLAGQDWS